MQNEKDILIAVHFAFYTLHFAFISSLVVAGMLRSGNNTESLTGSPVNFDF